MAIDSFVRAMVSHRLVKATRKKKASNVGREFKLFGRKYKLIRPKSQNIVCYDSKKKEFRECRWGEGLFIQHPYHFQKLGIHLRKRYGSDVESMAFNLLKFRHNIDLVKKYHKREPLRRGDVKKVCAIAKEVHQVIGRVKKLFESLKSEQRASFPKYLREEVEIKKACRLVELDAATLEALIQEANKRNP